MDTYIPIERALAATGELLAADGEVVRVVVVGGAALNLLGIVARTTRDVDVIALSEGAGGMPRLTSPAPMPPALERAIAIVARDLGIPPDWMNTMVASQWQTGLPPGLAAGLSWRRFGGLEVGLPGRFPLICLKLYAAADQRGPEGRHFEDLIALAPAEAELVRAGEWIATQDPTIGDVVRQVIEHASARLR